MRMYLHLNNNKIELEKTLDLRNHCPVGLSITALLKNHLNPAPAPPTLISYSSFWFTKSRGEEQVCIYNKYIS